MGEFASKGVAGSGLGLGIAGTALGVLNASANNGGGLLGGLFGGCNNSNQNIAAGAALNAMAEKDAKIAELTAMRYSDNSDASIYKQTLADNKTLRDEMYAYISPIAQEAASNRERVAVLEAQHKCEVEKTLLREQLIQAKLDNCCCEMNGKIDRVAQTAACGISQLQNAVAGMSNTLNSITKLVVPKDVICPEVMPRWNSWVAPTAGETAPATQPVQVTK